MWKNGSAASVRSRGRTGSIASTWATFATRLAWLSLTPLGSPVVPEE